MKHRLLLIIVLLLSLCAGLCAMLLIYKPAYFGERKSTSTDLSTLTVQPITSQQLISMIEDDAAPVTIINFWATWCGPCREEIPDLIKLQNRFKADGVKIIFVSLDDKDRSDEAISFLQSVDVSSQSYIKSAEQDDFMRQLYPDWPGALPSSIIYKKKDAVEYILGAKTEKEFAQIVSQLLASLKES